LLTSLVKKLWREWCVVKTSARLEQYKGLHRYLADRKEGKYRCSLVKRLYYRYLMRREWRPPKQCRKGNHDWQFLPNTLPENSYRCRRCHVIKIFDSVNQKHASPEIHISDHNMHACDECNKKGIKYPQCESQCESRPLINDKSS